MRTNEAKMRKRIFDWYSNHDTEQLLDYCKIIYLYGNEDFYISIIKVHDDLQIAR